jgi:hypothetical protein
MEVRDGWNTEMGRLKFDVTVDESDLARLLIEYGMEPGDRARLTTIESFQLLSAEAQYLSAGAAIQRGILPPAQGQPKLDELRDKRFSLISAVRARLHPETPSDDKPAQPAE